MNKIINIDGVDYIINVERALADEYLVECKNAYNLKAGDIYEIRKTGEMVILIECHDGWKFMNYENPFEYHKEYEGLGDSYTHDQIIDQMFGEEWCYIGAANKITYE